MYNKEEKFPTFYYKFIGTIIFPDRTVISFGHHQTKPSDHKTSTDFNKHMI
jgi:hypothetical protein